MTAQGLEELIDELTAYVKAETGESVSADTLLMESGVLDSMGMVFFVAHVEEAFDLQIAADELSEGVLRSVRDAAQFVARRRQPIEPATSSDKT